MTDFTQATGFHGVVERYLNCDLVSSQKEEGASKANRTNCGKIVLLVLLFLITIPALIIRSSYRASLKNRSVEQNPPAETITAAKTIIAASVSDGQHPLQTLRASFQVELQKVKMGQIQQKVDDFTNASVVLDIGGARIHLHGMAVENWGTTKVANTVAVHGRQNPKEYQWPVEYHAGLHGANVHYFHPDLEKMDLTITLNKTRSVDVSEEEAAAIAEAILNTVETTDGVTLSAFTIYSEDLEISCGSRSREDIKEDLISFIRKHVLINNDRDKGRPLKLVLNFDHGKEAEIEEKFTTAVTGALSAGNSVDHIESVKDCTSSYFAGVEGRDNIKRSIHFILESLLKGESVSVFCHQGKDRSAAIVFAALLYLSGDASEASQARVLQYLRTKRSIVSDYQKPSEQRNFIGPMVAAVTEMLKK